MYQRLVRGEKLREVSVSYIFALISTSMLSRIFSQALPSISKKHNYKIFTKRSPAYLLHCIENILNHLSGKCPDSLTIAAVSFAKSSGLCTIFIHYLLSNSCSVIIDQLEKR